MTARRSVPLAAELTARIEAVDGVVRIFPRRPVAVVLRAVGDVPTALVDVDVRGTQIAVAARIGIARTAALRDVIDRVAEALRAGDPDRPLRLELEIAYIE